MEKTTENSQILKYSSGDHTRISLISVLDLLLCGGFLFVLASLVCCLTVFNLFKDYSLISHGHRFQNTAMERPIDLLCCFMASPLSPESISQLQCVGKPLCERV